MDLKDRPLTKNETDLLKSVPIGWFNLHDVPYPRFRRAEYFLDRLVEKKYLEYSYFGDIKVWHKIKELK